MVLIHYKKSDNNQFLYKCLGTTPIDDLIKELVAINNLRIIIDKLAMSVEDLATHGPMKPEELRGLSDKDIIEGSTDLITDNAKKEWAKKREVLPGQRENEDPNHYRIGIILSEQLTQMMIDTANNAKNVINKKRVDEKFELTVEILKKEVDNLRGAMMISYPAYHGLGDWEPAWMILENKLDFIQVQSDVGDYLEDNDTALWWAGKELFKGKLLKDYVGKNEKTKIVAKLCKEGSGAPVREPVVDNAAYKNMVAFYHKKQEEMKKLEEDTDDNHYDQGWAATSNLKNSLQGTNNISWGARR